MKLIAILAARSLYWDKAGTVTPAPRRSRATGGADAEARTAL
jgi:hypothetical protein